jgi:hypothetical protein
MKLGWRISKREEENQDFWGKTFLKKGFSPNPFSKNVCIALFRKSEKAL